MSWLAGATIGPLQDISIEDALQIFNKDGVKEKGFSAITDKCTLTTEQADQILTNPPASDKGLTYVGTADKCRFRQMLHIPACSSGEHNNPAQQEFDAEYFLSSSVYVYLLPKTQERSFDTVYLLSEKLAAAP